MIIKNLTSKEIYLKTQNGTMLMIPPEEISPEVSSELTKVGTLEINGDEIPVYFSVQGKVTNLPEEEEGVIYIVTPEIQKAVPHRQDVFSRCNFVRENFRVYSSCGLVANE